MPRTSSKRQAFRADLESLEERVCLSTLFQQTVTGGDVNPLNLPAFPKGTILRITAELESTDPDDVQEGEPLTISSGGSGTGFAGEVEQPGVTLSFNEYIAQMDNEPFTAYIVGGDDDETATITVDVGTASRQRYSEQEKQGFLDISSQYSLRAERITAIASLVHSPLSTPLNELAAYYWDQSLIYADLASDPSDPNFTTVAPPQPPAIDVQSAASGLTQAEADAFNAVATNASQALGLGRAIRTALDRAQGAADANNPALESLQLQAVTNYSMQLGAILSAEPALEMALGAALNSAGVSDVKVSQSNVLALEDDVSLSGLPDALSQALQRIGTTDAQIQAITTQLTTADASMVAGSLFATLSDPAFAAEASTVANALGSTILLSGKLDPGSDTGASSNEGLTNDATPTYVGTAPPGTTVQLFAKRSDQGSPNPVGQTVSDGAGNWSLSLPRLNDGQYEISADFVGGQSGAGQPTPLGSVTIDTTPPKVCSVSYNAKTGVVTVIYTDAYGIDAASIINPVNYDARAGSAAHSHAYQETEFHMATPQSIVFTVDKGRHAHPSQFFLTVLPNGVHDIAGNAVALFKVKLPVVVKKPHRK
jgi:hypothetical protein